ncbi:MAG: alcohol dehydrogenase catalytic domain-containing protein [Acidimicrobiia bacterium]
MRAARLHKFDPDLSGEEFLKIEEVPDPSIDAFDDVIVRVGGAGVCRTDLHIVQGQWEEAQLMPLPYTLGHENAGWVEEVGDSVRSVRPGDAVIVLPGVTDGVCDACRRGLDNRCTELAWQGIQFDGGFAERLRTKARNLVPIPEGMTPADAAPYADAGITAYHSVRVATRGTVPGDDVVVVGVGGLGHVAIQVLRATTPARIIAIDASPEALSTATRFGADHAVLGGPDTVEQVLDLTSGRGAAAVIDFVGDGDTPTQAFAMTGTGGTQVVVGYGGSLDLQMLDIMGSERSIIGVVGGTYADLREVMALSASGRVELLVDQYPFEELNHVMTSLARGELHARAVMVHG